MLCNMLNNSKQKNVMCVIFLHTVYILVHFFSSDCLIVSLMMTGCCWVTSFPVCG